MRPPFASTRRYATALAAVALVVHGADTRAVFWGEAGHRIIGELAAELLPADMPEFFRNARAQLTYLNPEPDRWRDRAERAMDPAMDELSAPEHFIDLEMLPADRARGILNAPSRLAYADSLRTLGFTATKVGELPFQILELTQRLRVEFRLWRHETDRATRGWIEQRIINDAGILGHYAGDGSNPTHTSIHYNGWSGANPQGFATDKNLHSRFESTYVQARLTIADVRAAASAPPRVATDLRGSIIAYLRASNAEVEHLYALDKQEAFGATTSGPAQKKFTAERLAAGATMLRDLWWTVWKTSEE